MIHIDKVEIIKISIPLLKPMVTGFGAVHTRNSLLFKVYSGSVFGIGEAPVLNEPLYNHETPDSAYSFLKKVAAPLLKQTDFEHPDNFSDRLTPFRGNYFAKSAAVCAVYDLFAKLSNTRIVDLISGSKSEATISRTISVHEKIEDTLAEAQAHIDSGAIYLKLKIKPGHDIDPSIALKKAFPQAILMLDANSAYVLNQETISIFRKLDELDLYCIEQPLQQNDLIDHAKLQSQIKTSLALDESIESLYDTEKAIELGSCKLINIKIPRVGGLTNALRINKKSQEAGIKTWVGGMLESPVGFYTNLSLATVDNVDYPIDFLGALTYIAEYEKFFAHLPYSIQGDKIHIDIQATGFGMDLDWSVLNSFVSETVTI
ncbi:MAG: o-succinylbenzoate synthase [Candidatus Abawacabacteria bacterium]|nr:o-succinylbenzoate synthase [Candidatus Abawacabacteria bacterium]